VSKTVDEKRIWNRLHHISVLVVPGVFSGLKYLVAGASEREITRLNIYCRTMIPITNEKKLFVLVIILLGLGYPFLESFVYYKPTIEAIGTLKFRVRMIPSPYQQCPIGYIIKKGSLECSPEGSRLGF
jgi:hypothetical protein